jgi:hypothetical protein
VRTLAALAVAVTTALVAAAPALAKELTLTVCGVDECASLAQGPELRPLVSLASRSAPPPAEAPFYAATLRARGSAGVVVSFLYVPSQGVVRVDDYTSFWASVPGPLRRLLAQVTEGLEPYPGPPTSDEDRVPMWPALAAAAAALALVAAALRRVRRRRLAALGLAALAVLAVPGVASAKGPARAQLCGPTGCAAVAGELDYLGAGETVVAVPSPYYELRIDRGPGHASRLWYVPSARAVVSVAGVWSSRIDDEALRALTRVVGRVEPFPAPALRGALVGGRRVSGDAGTYLGLFEARSAGSATLAGTDWVRIELRSARDTPWTNGATVLDYSASENLLQRGPELIRLSGGAAADVEHARAIGDGRGGTLSPSLLTALVAGGIVIATAVGARSRAPARR